MTEIDTERPAEIEKSDVREYETFDEKVRRAKKAAKHAEETRPRKRKRHDDNELELY